MIDVRRLKSRMVESGLTQKELAAQAGMSPNSLNRKLNGKRPFSLDEAEKICKALSINDGEQKALIFFA